MLRLGDISRKELSPRLASQDLLTSLDRLLRAKRLIEIKMAGEKRLIYSGGSLPAIVTTAMTRTPDSPGSYAGGGVFVVELGSPLPLPLCMITFILQDVSHRLSSPIAR